MTEPDVRRQGVGADQHGVVPRDSGRASGGKFPFFRPLSEGDAHLGGTIHVIP